jgi:hypothetical protein
MCRVLVKYTRSVIMFFIQILKKLHFVELFEARDCIIGNNVSNINATIPAVFQKRYFQNFIEFGRDRF